MSCDGLTNRLTVPVAISSGGSTLNAWEGRLRLLVYENIAVIANDPRSTFDEKYPGSLPPGEYTWDKWVKKVLRETTTAADGAVKEIRSKIDKEVEWKAEGKEKGEVIFG
jgi:hypothetical protein